MRSSLPELVRERRSVRQFSGEHISNETIQNILELAAYAPSSGGGHPVEFIVIQDRKTMMDLARCKQIDTASGIVHDLLDFEIIFLHNDPPCDKVNPGSQCH